MSLPDWAFEMMLRNMRGESFSLDEREKFYTRLDTFVVTSGKQRPLLPAAVDEALKKLSPLQRTIVNLLK